LYAVTGPVSFRPFACPSVCLSRRSIAAATCGGFTAELGRGRQISIDPAVQPPCCSRVRRQLHMTSGPREFWSNCIRRPNIRTRLHLALPLCFHFIVFLSSRVPAMALCLSVCLSVSARVCLCLSVSVYLCLSQVGVLTKWLSELRWFFGIGI